VENGIGAVKAVNPVGYENRQRSPKKPWKPTAACALVLKGWLTQEALGTIS
jgi:hypothetical protein